MLAQLPKRGKVARKQSLDLPARIKVQAIPEDKTLSQMLKDGEIDALHTARAPSTFDNKHVLRLFPDFRKVELDYWRATRLFPTMHTIAIRREVYEANRWIAQSLFKAFVAAQRLTYRDLGITAALMAMLPWLPAHVEEARALMGDDYWPYGFAPNRHVLDTFLRYHHAQGLSKKRFKPEELFAPETAEAFKV